MTTVAVIGLGYVGLPLAVEFGKLFATIGYDLFAAKVASLRRFVDPAAELTEAELRAADNADFAAIARQLADGSRALEEVVDFMVANIKGDIKGVFAGSVLYLKLAGIVLGGWQMGRAALAAQRKLEEGAGDAQFYKAKIGTARFFADHILSQAPGLRTAIVDGSAGVLALEVDQF